MKTIALAVGSMAMAAWGAAFAQDAYDRHSGNAGLHTVADQARECWNPNARHYERVRPGERQGDLDFNNCRFVGEVPRDARSWSSGRQECWNPRAQHFEAVRTGERQDDLDFSRCRKTRASNERNSPRECWNRGAGHYEAVRPGERQDDLDFSRCR
ncbi:MAG: hypothetical protein ACXWG6_11430 [Usitatibacter sp.]